MVVGLNSLRNGTENVSSLRQLGVLALRCQHISSPQLQELACLSLLNATVSAVCLPEEGSWILNLSITLPMSYSTSIGLSVRVSVRVRVRARRSPCAKHARA